MSDVTLHTRPFHSEACSVFDADLCGPRRSVQTLSSVLAVLSTYCKTVFHFTEASNTNLKFHRWLCYILEGVIKLYTQNILNFLKEAGLHLKPHVLEKPSPDALQCIVCQRSFRKLLYLRLDFSGVGAKPQRAIFTGDLFSMG